MAKREWTLIREPKTPITKETDFPQVTMKKTWLRRKRQRQIKSHVNLVPDATLMQMARLFKCDRVTVLNTVHELAKKGDEGAIATLERWGDEKDQRVQLENDVRKFFHDNPSSTVTQCAAALHISRERAYRVARNLQRREPGTIRITTIPMQTAIRREQLAEYLLAHPTHSVNKAAEALGIPETVAKKICRGLNEEYNQRAMDHVGLMRQYCAEEIATTIKELTNFSKDNRQSMARCHEVKLQAVKLLMKLHNLDQPDTQINMQFNIDQTQRDAAAEAMLNHLGLEGSLKLPDFGQEVEVTPHGS